MTGHQIFREVQFQCSLSSKLSGAVISKGVQTIGKSVSVLSIEQIERSSYHPLGIFHAHKFQCSLSSKLSGAVALVSSSGNEIVFQCSLSSKLSGAEAVNTAAINKESFSALYRAN